MKKETHYFTAILFSLIFLLTPSKIFAHGNLTARINKKTIEISKNPKAAHLYYERGFLYQQHLEHNKAIKDYKKAESLGFIKKIIFFRKAEVLFNSNKTKEALYEVNRYLKTDPFDVKIHKLQSHILIKTKEYKKALKAYNYVIENTIDLRPEDFIEHANIILSIDKSNYNDAISSIDLGLVKLGENTLTLQLKKLEYLIGSGGNEKVITQYNYFISNEKRKESWYYKKATYLYENNKYKEATIALQQSKLSIAKLNLRTQQTKTIKTLIKNINQLEKTLSDEI